MRLSKFYTALLVVTFVLYTPNNLFAAKKYAVVKTEEKSKNLENPGLIIKALFPVKFTPKQIGSLNSKGYFIDKKIKYQADASYSKKVKPYKAQFISGSNANRAKQISLKDIKIVGNHLVGVYQYKSPLRRSYDATFELKIQKAFKIINLSNSLMGKKTWFTNTPPTDSLLTVVGNDNKMIKHTNNRSIKRFNVTLMNYLLMLEQNKKSNLKNMSKDQRDKTGKNLLKEFLIKRKYIPQDFRGNVLEIVLTVKQYQEANAHLKKKVYQAYKISTAAVKALDNSFKKPEIIYAATMGNAYLIIIP